MKNISLRRKVLQNTFYLYGSQFFQFLLSFIFLTYLARALNVTDFGRYSFLIAFFSVALAFATFGLDQLLVREIARNKKMVPQVLSAVLFLKLIFSAVTLLFAFFFSLHFPAELKSIFFIYLPFLFFNNLTLSFWYVADGHERMEFRSILSLVYQAVRVGLALLFIHFSPTLASLVFGLLLTEAISFIITVPVIIRFFGVKITRPLLPFALLKPALPFALAVFFVTAFYRLDLLILKNLSDDFSTGIYGLAQKLISFIIMLSTALTGALYPTFARLFGESRERLLKVFRHSFWLLFAAGLFFTLLTILTAGPLLTFFFGEKFTPSIKPLKILSLELPLLFATQSFFTVFPAINKQMFNVLLGIVGIISIILLSLILVPRFNYNGSALASVFSSCIVFLTAVFLWKKAGA